MKLHWLVVTALAGLTFGLDQGTKALVRGWPLGTRVSWIDGWLTIAHVENPAGLLGIGMDWSFAVRAALFVGGSVGLACAAAWWLHSLPKRSPLVPIAIGLIGGGALGNGLDRVFRGSVTDWVIVGEALFDPIAQMIVSGAHTPAFNLADVLLAGGVGVLLVHVIARAIRPATDS